MFEIKSVIIQNFSDILKDRGMRKTPERIKILEKVLDFKKQVARSKK